MQDIAGIGIGMRTNPPEQVNPGQTPTRTGAPLGYQPSWTNAFPPGRLTLSVNFVTRLFFPTARLLR